jgi:hypothetical protein
MVQKSYPFIFGGDFDLSSATAQMLRENFAANTSATGETISRCIAFLKDAAADAGIPVSPYILQKSASRAAAGKKRSPAKKFNSPLVQSIFENAPVIGGAPKTNAFAAQSSLLLSGLFQRLPKPGTPWAKDERERWAQTLNNVLLLEYPEEI